MGVPELSLNVDLIFLRTLLVGAPKQRQRTAWEVAALQEDCMDVYKQDPKRKSLEKTRGGREGVDGRRTGREILSSDFLRSFWSRRRRVGGWCTNRTLKYYVKWSAKINQQRLSERPTSGSIRRLTMSLPLCYSNTASFTEGKQVEVNEQFFASTVSIASALTQRDGKRSSQSGMASSPARIKCVDGCRIICN